MSKICYTVYSYQNAKLQKTKIKDFAFEVFDWEEQADAYQENVPNGVYCHHMRETTVTSESGSGFKEAMQQVGRRQLNEQGEPVDFLRLFVGPEDKLSPVTVSPQGALEVQLGSRMAPFCFNRDLITVRKPNDPVYIAYSVMLGSRMALILN